MIRVYGRFFTRCRKCNRLNRVELDTGFMDYDSAQRQPMGLEYFYGMEEPFECNCGNPYSIIIEAAEYPAGTFEYVHYCLNGDVEASNEPNIEAFFSEPDDWASENRSATITPASIIHEMTDRQFELFAASVLLEMGYSDVRVTKKTRDGGFDFTAVENRFGIRNYIIGECKHFGPGHKVDEDIIRKLHDVQYQEHANTAMVITSSVFTRDARKRANEYRMTLWDINDLLRYGSHLLQDYNQCY